MKRFLLGLIMVSGLAIVAAPMANAATSPTYICGTAAADHNYAFLVTGTEPVTATTTAATYPLNYIAGVGVLKFGPYSATFGGPGVRGCSIISGEMIYLDNDYQTFQGGPQDCPSVSSLDGVPCFDGGPHLAAQLDRDRTGARPLRSRWTSRLCLAQPKPRCLSVSRCSPLPAVRP